MARAVTTQKKLFYTLLAWAIGLLIFFPILWIFLTSFKTEAEAIADPPTFFFFEWTTENYGVVQERSDYLRFLWNSVILSLGSTFIGLLIAVPAAWSMAFVPGKRTKDLLLWMLSTKMLPAVGVLFPLVLIAKTLNIYDTYFLLIFVLTLINLPIIVWMLYTYFKENPWRDFGSGANGRRYIERRDSLRADTDGTAWYRINDAVKHHPSLERSVLDLEPHHGRCCTADGVHRQLLQPRRSFLRQTLGRFHHGHRADLDHGMV